MRHLQIYRCIAEVARCGAIRKAAEALHITPSALTRKIQDFEAELGTPVFERLPQGMRLNAAGDLLLCHIRNLGADFERLRSDLADIEGIRRGHVAVACAQAFVDTVLPAAIASYRATYPQVTFSVDVRDNRLGIAALASFESDLALLIDPPPSLDLEELMVKQQPLCAVVASSHPLAREKSPRLQECLRYPVALPAPSLAIRAALDAGFSKRKLEPRTVVESGSLEFLRAFVTKESAVTFLPLTGVPQSDARIVALPIRTIDIPPVRVVLGKLKGRRLSIAAEKFADQLRGQMLHVS